MGRSGGGGGSRGGGGFSGGGRSSGGFSGGGRSGRSYGGSSRGSGGYYRPGGIRTGPIIVRTGGTSSYGSSGSSDGSPGRRNSGCGTVLATVIVLLVLAWIFTWVMSGSMGGSSSVQKSTYAREKLPSSAVTETGYYTDQDGWFSNRSELEGGMQEFYRLTGVQPYLYLLPNGSVTSTVELTAMAEELYSQLFTDEGHFLLVFCDDDNGSYNCGYTAGTQAKTVMDDEAVAILADYLDRYYHDYSISEEEIFSNTFAQTGERIMTVTKSPLPVIAVSVAVVVVAALVFITLKKRREQREREQKRAEEILRTPLEKFGDQDVEDLAQKYENQDS